MTDHDFREILESKYNREEWKNLLHDIFGNAVTLKIHPSKVEIVDKKLANEIYELGEIKLQDDRTLALYEVKLNSKVNLYLNRAGIRRLLTSHWSAKGYDGCLMLCHQDKADDYRLSYVSREWTINREGKLYMRETPTKGCTFILGPSQRRRTAFERLQELKRSEKSLDAISKAFSVEALTKDFYTKLFSWYEWALSDKVRVTFPMNPATEKDDREGNAENLIRLITRLLFVWFIKQKKLVPDDLFEPVKLRNILKDFEETSSENGNYYNAILQNLFFATLNRKIVDEKGEKRHFATKKEASKNLYRYKEMFTNPEEDVIALFGKIPFLNGGLFECLDKKDSLYDGFSRKDEKSKNGNFMYRAFLPNILFFNDDENQPGLINLLNQYNFTIEENSSTDAVISLDPELLGMVFENLLGAYNPETKETARNQSGSFYTPRAIVEYMVDETLKSYLISKKIDGVDKETLNTLFNSHTLPEKWEKKTKENLCKALKGIKILDPACGSGAFPMECLHRIVEILELLTEKNDKRYDLKLSIIENCIYGVDIQPIAMLICKLRFFISLVCEQNDIDYNSPETNFGINPLPNLETKFVAADTLISADIRKFDDDWTNDKKLEEMKNELLNIRNNYFLANDSATKKSYRQEDDKTRQKISVYIAEHAPKSDPKKIEQLNNRLSQLSKESEKYKKKVWETKKEQTLLGEEEYRVDINKEKRNELTAKIKGVKADLDKEENKDKSGFEAAIKELTAWNPYDQNAVSPFFDPEWMFCLNDKFDIVIGNPPYIQLLSNKGKLAKRYEDCGYSTFARTGDIYCLFYERGWQLLKEGGHLCYITSNKWMRSEYGENTRNFFATKTNPMLLIDFAGVQIFKSATVDTNIMLFSKSSNLHKTVCAVANNQNKDIVKNLSVFVQQQGTVCNFPSSDSWVILSPIEQSIKLKIEAVGTPLKDWDINIYRGVLTGYNEAFIISSEKREEILRNCRTEDERKRTEELIRPILRGRDIKRYGYEWANLYLIATFPARHYDIEDYPSVRDYLLSFAEENLFKAGYDWVAKNYLADFCKQKLAQTGRFVEIAGKRIVIENTPEKARKKTTNKWFETQDSISYWEDFFKPKIVYPELAQGSSFCYDKKGAFFVSNSGYIITGENLNYLLAFLNSRIVEFVFRNFYAVTIGAAGVRWLYHCMINLPIPIPRNQSIPTSEDEIAQLYGLSEEEKRFIENNPATSSTCCSR